MTIKEFEEKVWNQDGIRVVVRAPENTQIGTYVQQNAAQANWSITQFVANRLSTVLNGHEVKVLMGDGTKPHGRTKLSTIRESYRHQ